MSNEKNLTLQVRLVHDPHDGDDYNMLVINEGDHHHAFDRLQDPTRVHTISWVLAGNAHSGEFCALDDADNPGFTWLVRTPGSSVFQNLRLTEPGRMTISNRHRSADSKGHWYYQLFARFGTRVYGVPLTFANGIGNNPNPSIKNL